MPPPCGLRRCVVQLLLVATCAKHHNMTSWSRSVAIGMNSGTSVLARAAACASTWLGGFDQVLILTNRHDAEDTSMAKYREVAGDAAERLVATLPKGFRCGDQTVPCNQMRFLYLVVELRRRYPHALWYFIADDDLWVRWKHILVQMDETAKKYPSSARLALGLRSGPGRRSWGDPKKDMTNGGFYAFNSNAFAELATSMPTCVSEFFYARYERCTGDGASVVNCFRKLKDAQSYLAQPGCSARRRRLIDGWKLAMDGRGKPRPNWWTTDFNGECVWWPSNRSDNEWYRENNDDHVIEYCNWRNRIDTDWWHEGMAFHGEEIAKQAKETLILAHHITSIQVFKLGTQFPDQPAELARLCHAAQTSAARGGYFFC